MLYGKRIKRTSDEATTFVVGIGLRNMFEDVQFSLGGVGSRMVNTGIDFDSNISFSKPAPPSHGFSCGWDTGYAGHALMKISSKPDGRATTVTKFRSKLIAAVQDVPQTGRVESHRIIVRRTFFLDGFVDRKPGSSHC
jgi:hypothetical protein